MAAYDDCYEIADLEKEFPSANASKIRRILRERHAKAHEEWKKARDLEEGVPLPVCPTTGRTLVQEIKSHANQGGEELDPQSGNPGVVRDLDERLDVSFVNEKTQEARARYP